MQLNMPCRLLLTHKPHRFVNTRAEACHAARGAAHQALKTKQALGACGTVNLKCHVFLLWSERLLKAFLARAQLRALCAGAAAAGASGSGPHGAAAGAGSLGAAAEALFNALTERGEVVPGTGKVAVRPLAHSLARF